MSEKPTPGPWNYQTTPGSDHEYCTVYAAGNGKAIARHVLPEDARLIAAAPALLAACEAYLDAMERYGHPDKTDRLMLAAISKAN